MIAIVNFGPQHPAAHGVLRLILELDGEVSLDDMADLAKLIIPAGNRQSRPAHRTVTSSHGETHRVQDLYPSPSILRSTRLRLHECARYHLREAWLTKLQ